jgi:multidrug transporter EmrE-like cation transporter
MIVIFLAALAAQLIGVGLLPRTAGFTVLVPTLLCATVLVLSFALIARLLAGGANLSILAPLMSAVVPLGATLIGVMLYGEKASIVRVGVLCLACALIGLASRIA